jgi:nicotinate-nucleotide pyrophosphorylase (carboxylating)
LVPEAAQGRAVVVARRAGIVAGLPAARLVLEEYDRRIVWTELLAEGARVAAGDRLATLEGPARSLLTAERPMLNMLGHLSGIATLTGEYVAAVAGTRARIYDTRKTMPGWRLLEKYAVRQGGGINHRRGLFDGILIKDNHLAFAAGQAQCSPADAVRRARELIAQNQSGGDLDLSELLVEVEVDTLEQLAQVLPSRPDIILLDNMPPARLREAVAMRDQAAAAVELEASGGINLSTVRAVAESGVDRISAGALTHSVEWFDVGLDWER